MLSPQQARALHEAETTTGARHGRAVMPIVSRKWMNGVVPYQLSSDFSEYDQVIFILGL